MVSRYLVPPPVCRLIAAIMLIIAVPAWANYHVSLINDATNQRLYLGDRRSLGRSPGGMQSDNIYLKRAPEKKYFYIGLLKSGYSSDIKRFDDPMEQLYGFNLNNEQGYLAFSPVQPGWHSAMWIFEPQDQDNERYRIKNRWKNTYLKSEGNVLALTSNAADPSTLWKASPRGRTATNLNSPSAGVIRLEKGPGYNAIFVVNWIAGNFPGIKVCKLKVSNPSCNVDIPPLSKRITVSASVDMPVQKDKPIDSSRFQYASPPVACIRAAGTIWNSKLTDCDTSKIGVPLVERQKLIIQ